MHFNQSHGHTLTFLTLLASFDFLLLQEKSESGKAASLSIANVGGIFVVLLAGLGIACITAFVEYLWTGRKTRRARQV